MSLAKLLHLPFQGPWEPQGDLRDFGAHAMHECEKQLCIHVCMRAGGRTRFLVQHSCIAALVSLNLWTCKTMFLVQQSSLKSKNLLKRTGGQKEDQEEQDEAKAKIRHQKILCICLSIA